MKHFPTALAAAASLSFALLAASASAQRAVCAAREDIVRQLRAAHGETRQSLGLQLDGRVMETYANPETGSWTIIVTLPSGAACLVAAGEAFMVEPQGASGEGA